MQTILLCDDDENDLKRLQEMVTEWIWETGASIRCHAFSRPEELTAYLAQNSTADIYILDVLMPEQNGIDLGRLIRDIDRNGRIIYLTSTREFAVDSYEVDAFYYLMKPVTRERLFPLLADALQVRRDHPDASVCIHTRDGDVMIRLDDIDYVESSMRFPRYITQQGRYTGLMLRGSFREEIKDLLANPRFYLCGASFLLNLSHIKAIEKTGALFFSGQSVTLPRTSLAGLRRVWSDFYLDR